ncbi:K(+)-transporting ATPase subunit C [Corynebacterium heidelbergense]|uniref:Potassium-transporting ATPase KdpC subunit n=1 Tax=Corynebacterium heidelbergense TaxID=2055947 RepID=A0A364VB33_9CORY|nr:K(+)-transporting ATPase subunit C [Corynebacterium heidelbergense]RAV33847.1 K(+)-transporting ATPase subunit C [Corynebacterium heidelbergense]WCZ36822.1 Potassium-transporting ATPase C chain [Corynebacterium heidelbergense]
MTTEAIPETDRATRRSLRSSNSSSRVLLTAIRSVVLFTVVLGIVYPLVVFGIGRLMPNKADGSMVHNSAGQVVGSSLIGQAVDKPGFFFPRPSAAGDEPGYDAMSSGASNISPADQKYRADIAQLREKIATREGVSVERVPVDAITSSGSGLDPQISRAYADLQVNRVAKERGVPVERVRGLVEEHTHTSFNGAADGKPVNVVELNEALTRI